MYIKITDVNKTIKKAPILRDINLEFTGGKVYGLRMVRERLCLCVQYAGLLLRIQE